MAWKVQAVSRALCTQTSDHDASCPHIWRKRCDRVTYRGWLTGGKKIQAFKYVHRPALRQPQVFELSNRCRTRLMVTRSDQSDDLAFKDAAAG